MGEIIQPLLLDKNKLVELKEKLRKDKIIDTEPSDNFFNKEVDITGARISGIFVYISVGDKRQDESLNEWLNGLEIENFAILMAMAIKYDLPIVLITTPGRKVYLTARHKFEKILGRHGKEMLYSLKTMGIDFGEIDFKNAILQQIRPKLDSDSLEPGSDRAYRKQQPFLPENKKPDKAKLNKNTAYRVLRILYGQPERGFDFEEIKKKIGFEITDDELQLVLNDLCKKGYVIKVEDRLPALIEGFIKAIRQPKPVELKEQTSMQKYGKSLLVILYPPRSIPKDTSHTKTEFQNLIRQMRKNYKQIAQSYIANTPVNRNTTARQQLNLLERIAGRKLDRDKIDKQFAHKLLEYITSDKSAQPSLEGLAKFMGMELGKLPRAETTAAKPQEINEHRLLFEEAA